MIGSVFFWLAPLLSAGAFYLAFNLHPGSWGWAFIAWLPLLALAERSGSRRSALGLGLLAGFSFNFIELFWITNSIAGFTSLPHLAVNLIMALLALYLGLYYALFSGLWHYLRNLPGKGSGFAEAAGALTLAAVWILLEDLRSSLLGGFPWHPLGLTQLENHYLNWLLPWGGVRLLSGLIMLGNAGLFLSLNAIFAKNLKKAALHVFFLLGPLLALALFAGSHAPVKTDSYLASSTPKAPNAISVAVIQPNIPQKDKWLPENREIIIAKMIAMTQQSLDAKPDLIVWPEAALPLLLEREETLNDRLQELVNQHHTGLMLGGPRYVAEPPANLQAESRKKLYNAIFLFTPKNPVQIYNKIKLVPYGEFTPLAEFFPFISKIVPGLDYSAGSKIKNLALKNLKIAPSVCFEGVFPAFTARFFGAGANFLANLTNDAWFGDSPGPRQHLLNIRLRALENNCFIVRCANTGISAIINPQGKIEQQLPLNQEGIIAARVSPVTNPTFFARHPDLTTIVAGFIALASLLIIFFCRSRAGLKGNS
ncbi:MAG: apolipoprotein N-acyltransferase [Deltaproteobacteria bacterium]|nr:apolipoprotein N-acyltransferase [Deltaproteobacteria bacterium]